MKTLDKIESALDAANAGTFRYDCVNDIVYWDQRSYRIFGVNPNTFGNNYQAWLELLHPDDVDEIDRKYRHIIETQDQLELEYRLRDRGQGVRWIYARATIERDGKGDPIVIRGVHIDDTKHKENEERLRLYLQVFQSTSEAIAITDLSGNITDVNPAFEKVTGYSRKEVIGRNHRILQSGKHDISFYKEMWETILSTGSWRGEVWDRRKNGDVFPTRLIINTLRNSEQRALGYIGLFDDISNQKASERKIEYLSYKDSITQLPNRASFQKQFSHAISIAKRRSQKVALLYIDLDQFKDVNDTLGHAVGDKLLAQVGVRLTNALGKDNQVFRIGGDEFAIILNNIDSDNAVSVIADNLIENVSKPFSLNENEVIIGCSVGISLYPKDGEDVHELTKYADIAMFQAKVAGRNNYRFFTRVMNIKIQERVELANDLKSAVQNHQLELYFQPQVELESGKMVGVEALMRWHHPTRGIVSPVDFIPVAEETGLIVPMGHWTISEVCRLMERLDDPSLYVAINLSPRQFKDELLVTTLKRELKQYGIRPEQLEIELTESMMMDNIEYSIRMLEELKSLGIKIAMDDFGTGYSSLSYLKKFPIDTLKIDRSFIRDLFIGHDDTSIVTAIIEMAKSLKIKLVSEGIETERQRIFLSDQGCGIGQGYLFSHPVPSEELFETASSV